MMLSQPDEMTARLTDVIVLLHPRRTLDGVVAGDTSRQQRQRQSLTSVVRVSMSL